MDEVITEEEALSTTAQAVYVRSELVEYFGPAEFSRPRGNQLAHILRIPGMRYALGSQWWFRAKLFYRTETGRELEADLIRNNTIGGLD